MEFCRSFGWDASWSQKEQLWVPYTISRFRVQGSTCSRPRRALKVDLPGAKLNGGADSHNHRYITPYCYAYIHSSTFAQAPKSYISYGKGSRFGAQFLRLCQLGPGNPPSLTWRF